MSASLINEVSHARKGQHSTKSRITQFFSQKRSKNEIGQTYPEVVIGRIFRLRERETTIKNEVKAGIVHFVSVAFLLAVNPVLLADAGYDKATVAAATGLSTGIACILSGIICNLPFGNQFRSILIWRHYFNSFFFNV
jgi:hypothetical protein